MRISDWSSDVCSSDLQQGRGRDSGKRGRGPIVRLDITDAASWAGAVEAAVGAFGKLPPLYNTAGIIHGALIQDETLEGWSKMIAVIQTALFLGLKRSEDRAGGEGCFSTGRFWVGADI